MDGLGLAVCWACCPGPNAGFATDGQSIVAVDSAASKDELIANEAERRWMSERTDRNADADGDPGMDAAVSAVRRVMRLSSVEWEPLRRLIRSADRRGLRLAADEIGIARHLLVGGDSCVRRILGRLAEVGGGDWEVLRARVANASLTAAGGMMGVTKQAASKREAAIRARCDWYDRFVESLERADKPFFCDQGVITPRKQKNTRAKPHGDEQQTRAGARDANSLSHPDFDCQD